MSSILWKHFYLCFSKFKSSPEYQNFPSSPTINPTTTATSSPTLIKNYNSLYDLTSASTSKSLIYSSADGGGFFSSSDDFSDDTDTDSPPDLAAVFASQRFFFSSPGRSNSIVDSPESPPESGSVLTGGVAVQTYSPDPYADFRRSMQEMIESRELTDVKANWAYLHELLNCYLTLNPKHTHKFIISAFTDLLISLISATTSDGQRKHNSGDPQFPDLQWFV